MNPFLERGNSEIATDVQSLHLAKITAVDTTYMMADIEFLEKASYRTRVPLSMPMAYPGGGIFSVPRKGAIVIVGIRPMQMPVILAYYPANTFAPDSFFAIWKQTFGMPENLGEGDIYIRAKSDVAKCDVCGVISPEAAWEANLDSKTILEQCPNCKSPAVILGENQQITQSNKVPLGSTLLMRSNGDLVYQASNLSSDEDGDTERILKIAIEGKSGDISIQNAGDITESSTGHRFIGCQKFTRQVDDAIEDSANTRNYHTLQLHSDQSQDRNILADNALTVGSKTYSLTVKESIVESAKSRTIQLSGDDNYQSGSFLATIDGDRTAIVLGNDEENISGSKTVNVGTETTPADLTIGVLGSVIKTISQDEGATIQGNYSVSVAGEYSLEAQADALLKSLATLNLQGAPIVMNNGTLEVARKTDSTQITSATDSAFITFLSDLAAFTLDVFNSYNAHGHSAFNVPPSVPITATAPTAPTTVTGAITSGAAQVKA